MKQIPITPEITAMIQSVAGADVETAGLAVFEVIALNTLPLPGKKGSLWEKATITPLTLRQMAEYTSTKGVPLVQDHDKAGNAMGKVFNAQFFTDTTGNTLTGELRALFYLDATETVRIAKLNTGVMDEVSVGFQSTQLLCSECGWDYLGDAATYDNVVDRTCGNGHTVGTDGVHVVASGLDQFVELSLVTRGAAKNPKVVGVSSAKLPGSSLSRLAAKGFEVDELCLFASLGVENLDYEMLVGQLTASAAAFATLTATSTADKLVADANVAALAAANTEIETLKASLASVDTSSPAELAEAKAALGAQLSALMTAVGETPPAEMPATIAALKADIDARTLKLTALIPVGGASQAAGGDSKTEPSRDFSAFQLTK